MKVQILQPIIVELQARDKDEIVTITDQSLCNRLLKAGYVREYKEAITTKNNKSTKSNKAS